MLDRIIVTTDFSDLAKTAYPLAASLAAEYGSEIHLVHVCSPFYYSEIAVDYPQEKLIEHLRSKLENQGKNTGFAGQNVVTKLLVGPIIHQELVGYAEELNAGLIVMATHGRSGLSHFLLGSVAERVLRHSPVPVLNTRLSDNQTEGWHPQHVLVPIDFSENSLSTLPTVRFLSEHYGTRFTFAHVTHVDGSFIPGFGGSSEYCDWVEQEKTESALRADLRFGEIRAKEIPSVEAKIKLLEGKPDQKICELAQSENFDMILLSTHGRTGLAHLTLGSVAERVLRQAPCSVLSVRPDKVVFEEKSEQQAQST